MKAVYASAVISECGKFRYRLERRLEKPGKFAVFIMVNPSTADGTQDDATIRKLIGFSDRLGIGSFAVGNLFAFRATDIKDLGAVGHASEAIGPENDIHLISMIASAEVVICAWGPVSKLPKGLWRRRWQTITTMLESAGKQPYCLGDVAMDGHPRHPLMLSYDAALTPWEGRYAASM